MELSEEEMNTPYLLYGLTFIVCDVLMWYRQYADKNADVAKTGLTGWISVRRKLINGATGLEENDDSASFTINR